MEKIHFALIDKGDFSGKYPFVSHTSDARFRLKNLIKQGIGDFIIQLTQEEYDLIKSRPDIEISFNEHETGIKRFFY